MDAAISLDSVVVASRDQVSCRLEDEVAIVNVKAGVYYGLDPVGARVWELIGTLGSVRSIRDALLAEYDVDPERCQADLVALLQALAEAGLIEVTGAASR
jgi:hypothetical protein